MPSPTTLDKAVRTHVSRLTENDLFLFNEGSHHRIYQKLGAHPMSADGVDGTYFAVWAPNAKRVAVMGNFNDWDRRRHTLAPRGSSGIWEGFVAGVAPGAVYKYFIESHHDHYTAEKADPVAAAAEVPPRTASVVADLSYQWNDGEWMKNRHQANHGRAPVSTYEVHLGSWLRSPANPDQVLGYRELAPKLAAYVKETGFTHVELMPIMEHPFYGSWGYQCTGFFAPTSRYGPPQDFMFLIDTLHQNGIGVILDWVPSHFPSDGHGLGYFDGTHLYEHQDPRKGFHPDWNSLIFNYGRNEVRSFLLSSALIWLDRYHIDGLRVDAVASMIYLDYSRKDGEWIPNRFGGNENLEALSLLRRFNEVVYKEYPDTQTIAEESTAWPMVSRPTYVGGVGFGMKWDMGWMHDTLRYLQRDPIYRTHHHHELSFRMIYAFNENFVLSLSHDEVVHGKGSLISKMPGDDWQKFANLRLMFGYMFASPGKKLVFMGGEFGQWSEWRHDHSLDWNLLNFEPHRGLKRWVSQLNEIYRREPALHELDFDHQGFEWIDANDAQQSVFTFMRRGKSTDDVIVAALNFTPVPRHNYTIGVPRGGFWQEIANSDASDFGGSGQGNFGGVQATESSFHGRPFAVTATLPPLGAVLLKSGGAA